MTEKDKKQDMLEKTVLYDSIIGVFNSIYGEIQGLAKKSPKETMNKNKINNINRVLTDVQSIFEGSPQIKYLDLLSDEELPQFSDALIVMAQYDGALKTFREKYANRTFKDRNMVGNWRF